MYCDEKILNEMVNKVTIDLTNEIAKTDHPITKLAIIARHEGYGIALKDLGTDTKKLGSLIEIEAKKIEPALRKYF